MPAPLEIPSSPPARVSSIEPLLLAALVECYLHNLESFQFKRPIGVLLIVMTGLHLYGGVSNPFDGAFAASVPTAFFLKV
jgi:hypothetical protein